MNTEAAQAKDDERLAMLAALVNGDVPLAYRLATELLAHGVPFDDIVVDVLSPVQEELGRRWATGDLGVADEHAASAAVDDLLVRLGATAESPSGPAVVVASAEHDAHALGGRVVASALALEGYRVMFLGASLPAADLADFLDMQQPLALALELLHPNGARRSGPFGRRCARARRTRCGRRPRSPYARARDPPRFRRATPSSPATQSGSCRTWEGPDRSISSPHPRRFPNSDAFAGSRPRARRGRDSPRARTAIQRPPSPTNCSVCCRSSKVRSSSTSSH